nr:MAG TPA: disulfide isomerase [Caudoviricetes sp.]
MLPQTRRPVCGCGAGYRQLNQYSKGSPSSSHPDDSHWY